MTDSQHQRPVFGDPDTSPWAREEREADREAAAILGDPSPQFRAGSPGSADGRLKPIHLGHNPHIRLITAVAGLVVMLGMAIFAGSAAPGSAVPSPQPRASMAAPAVGAATPVPSSSSRPSPLPTAHPTPSPTPTVRTTRVEYQVRSGDTLSVIAARYGVTIEQIVLANRIPDPKLIYTGQILEIPPPGPAPAPTVRTTRVEYQVRSGDTLSAIAARYGVTIEQIVLANRIPDPKLIYSGQILVIPPPIQASP